MSEAPACEFALDAHDAHRHQAQGAYQLNVIQTPLLRLIGYSLLLGLAWVHNQFIFQAFAWIDFVQMATLCALYSGLSGLVQRVSTVDGRVEVSSPSGGPTVVTVVLPMKA